MVYCIGACIYSGSPEASSKGDCKIMRKKWVWAAALSVFLLFFSACSKSPAESEKKSYNDSRLGVVTGSLYDGYSRTLFPDAKIDYYNTFADLFQCVKQEKIDAFMLDEAAFNAVQRTDGRLKSENVPEYSVELGFGFQKNKGGDKLQQQMNTLLDELRSNGSMDEMIEKWYGATEPEQTLFPPDLYDNPTPLNVAIDTTRKPFVYLLNNQPAGMEMEILYLFCERYGYRPLYSDVPFASGLAGLAGEKYDLVCGGLYMTAERKKSVNFSDPYMTARVIMVTYDRSDEDFFSKIATSFDRTIIQQDRWKLILSGLLTTLLISSLTVIFGSILGLAIFFGKESDIRWVSGVFEGISRISAFILHGTPVLVLLMLLYYTVFGSSAVSGSFVSVIGFSCIFASFVEQNLTRTVDAVDIGQSEAAYALGYSKSKALFKIILPQAMNLFLPLYSEEIIFTIKSTSIVGYIAVNDLTKMADIIRNNTFIAIFPLLAVTVCYFALTISVAACFRLLQKRITPKHR